jgi:hypothetical protein
LFGRCQNQVSSEVMRSAGYGRKRLKKLKSLLKILF